MSSPAFPIILCSLMGVMRLVLANEAAVLLGLTRVGAGTTIGLD